MTQVIFIHALLDFTPNPAGFGQNRASILPDFTVMKTDSIIKVYEFEVSESVSPGTAVGRVVVNDGDGSESVTLQIRDVTARQYFRVQSNGQIFTNRKIDYEQKKR